VLDRPQAIELSLVAMGTNRLKPLKNSAWVFGGQLNAKESLYLKIRNMQYDIDQSTKKGNGLQPYIAEKVFTF
jgi:hypothetical protein